MWCICNIEIMTLKSLLSHCCSLPGSSIHGIFQARILGWVAISFSRALAWASLAQRFPASSVLAWEGAGCGSVTGAWLASAPLSPSLWT